MTVMIPQARTATPDSLALEYSVAEWLQEVLGDAVDDLGFGPLVDAVVEDLTARFARHGDE